MAILKPFRRKGIGKKVIAFLKRELKRQGITQVILHAQCDAAGFYKSCGFEETGAPFWEADIKHIKMQLQL
jgi:predicted GNAT family N-acyltransferase